MTTASYDRAFVRDGPVSFQRASADRKLAPQDGEPYVHPKSGRKFVRPIPRAPFVAATYVSIEATCPELCRFKNNGCYVQSGLGGARARKLDEAAKDMSPDEVTAWEALVVNAQWPDGVDGRPLRMHVGGDVANTSGAYLLADAARLWLERGGGPVWTYTHRWTEIPRRAWGPIHVLASVESLEEAEEAAVLGYVPAFTMRYFASERAWRPKGSRLRVVPCPAQTRSKSCVECRLCMRDLPKGTVIGFAMHGVRSKRTKRHLPVMWEQVDARMDHVAEGLDEVRAMLPETERVISDALDAMGISGTE